MDFAATGALAPDVHRSNSLAGKLVGSMGREGVEEKWEEWEGWEEWELDSGQRETQ